MTLSALLVACLASQAYAQEPNMQSGNRRIGERSIGNINRNQYTRAVFTGTGDSPYYGGTFVNLEYSITYFSSFS